MKTFINLNGEIENLTYKEIKKRTGKSISWDKMHFIHNYKCDSLRNKDIYHTIKKYLGNVTVFNFNNMVEWGYCQLFPHFVEVALKNGAIDLRGVKE